MRMMIVFEISIELDLLVHSLASSRHSLRARLGRRRS